MARFTALFSALALVACGSPSLDDLNAVVSDVDPRIDDTPPGAPFEPRQRRDIGDADAELPSTIPNEFFSGVAMPGDLDGDGYGDLVLWADRSAPAEVVDCEHGCPAFAQLVVYIAYGGPDFGAGGAIAPDVEIDGWFVNGTRSWIEGAGDVNGDGLADLLISVGGHCQQGNVFELRGGPRRSGVLDVRDVASVVRETGACTDFGIATGVGDLDADGRDDVVIAAPEAGRGYLFYGRTEVGHERRSELDADAVLVTERPDGVGPARPAGDVDGDGYDDFLVAHAPSRTSDEPAGTWHLVRGGARLTGEVRIESGATRIDAAMVQTLGDLDGDGRDELGVSTHRAGVDAYVLAGRDEWPSELGPAQGVLALERTMSGAATALHPAGDVNGDGHLDFVYTDSRESGDDRPRGAVHLFVGPHALGAPTLERATSTAWLGRHWRAEHDGAPRGDDVLGEWSWVIGDGFAAGSDLDGDGLAELAVLARSAPDYGRVHVIRGRR